MNYRLALIVISIAFVIAGCGTEKFVVRGETGASGKDGDSCVVTQNPNGATITCENGSVSVINGQDGVNGINGTNGQDGAQGAQGEKGDKGDKGDAGAVGPQGPAGANGSNAIATIVNLCSGNTSYPGVFVEVALCLNNQLYGVYSANGGFLTYLPPGNYTSNGIGSACNLTVLPNCQVSH